MDGCVGRLHCHYRMIGNERAGIPMLDRLVQARVGDALTNALTQALGDDPTVYVFRHLHVRTQLNLDDAQVVDQFTDQLGVRIAQSVKWQIAYGPPEGADQVRFADQADYVAHFVIDLLAGHAWHHWYYDAFAYVRERDLSDAIQTVLLDNRAHFAGILARLRAADALRPVLSMAHDAALRDLWTAATGAPERIDAAAVRPLFAAALRVLDRLNLWMRPVGDRNALFDAYLNTGPFDLEWHEPGELSAGVLAVMGFLGRTGCLRRVGGVLDADELSRVAAAIDDLDWLDRPALTLGLLRLLDIEIDPSEAVRAALAAVAQAFGWLDDRWLRRILNTPTVLPARPRAALTPTQRDLLRDLAAALSDPGIGLDRAHPDSAANACRLLAALVAINNRWAGDAQAARLIQRLLAALSTPSEPAARDLLGELGPAAQPLVKQLVDQADRAQDRIETGCAGVFLLLRALLDARVAALVPDPDWLRALLLALGLRWAGPVLHDQPDSALIVLAGSEPPLTLDDLRAFWAHVPAGQLYALQTALLRQLAGRRLVTHAALHVYRLPESGGLVAGDSKVHLWWSGEVSDAAPEAVIDRWRTTWAEVTGNDSPPVTVEAADETLLAALAAVDHGQLGLPAVDLVVALAAIALVRLWAVWLRGFAHASTPFLLQNMIRRAGTITRRADEWLVEMEPLPLDVVVEMAGYTAELERIPWMDARRVRFQWRGVSCRP